MSENVEERENRTVRFIPFNRCIGKIGMKVMNKTANMKLIATFFTTIHVGDGSRALFRLVLSYEPYNQVESSRIKLLPSCCKFYLSGVIDRVTREILVKLLRQREREREREKSEERFIIY